MGLSRGALYKLMVRRLKFILKQGIAFSVVENGLPGTKCNLGYHARLRSF